MIEANAVTGETLERLFGVSHSHLMKLASSEIVVRIAHGLFDQNRSTLNYIKILKSQAKAATGDMKQSALAELAALRRIQRELLEDKRSHAGVETIPRAEHLAHIAEIGHAIVGTMLTAADLIVLRLHLSKDDGKQVDDLISSSLNYVLMIATLQAGLPEAEFETLIGTIAKDFVQPSPEAFKKMVELMPACFKREATADA